MLNHASFYDLSYLELRLSNFIESVSNLFNYIAFLIMDAKH